MSREFEESLEEWCVWFHHHKDDGGDVHKKIEFLMKAVEGCLDLLVSAAEDVQRLEKRNPGDPTKRDHSFGNLIVRP